MLVGLSSEVAKGNQIHSIHRAAEASLAGASEIKARLKGQTFERSADQVALDSKRSRRQPYWTFWFQTVGLDFTDDRTVSVDAP
jgi:hypothetical protein